MSIFYNSSMYFNSVNRINNKKLYIIILIRSLDLFKQCVSSHFRLPGKLKFDVLRSLLLNLPCLGLFFFSWEQDLFVFEFLLNIAVDEWQITHLTHDLSNNTNESLVLLFTVLLMVLEKVIVWLEYGQVNALKPTKGGRGTDQVMRQAIHDATARLLE